MKGELHLNGRQFQEQRPRVRVGAVATLLSAVLTAAAPAPAVAMTTVGLSVAHDSRLVAQSVPADAAKLTTPAPSPSRAATGTSTVSPKPSTWTVVVVWVLFGLWMLALAGIVTWLAVARKRDSS